MWNMSEQFKKCVSLLVETNPYTLVREWGIKIKFDEYQAVQFYEVDLSILRYLSEKDYNEVVSIRRNWLLE
jgi:hypothetical protein